MTPAEHRQGSAGRLSKFINFMVAVVFVTALVAISVFTPSTHGAFTASIKNQTNTAEVVPYLTCREALASEKGGVFAYQLNTANPVNLINGNNTISAEGLPVSGLDSGCLHEKSKGFLTFPGTRLAIYGTFLTHEVSAPPTQSYTQEAWFRTSTASGGLMFFANTNDYPVETNTNRQLYLNDAGHLTMSNFTLIPRRFERIESLKPVTDGKWHHVIAVRDSKVGHSYLYLDGLLVDDAPTTLTLENFSPGYWRIGCARLVAWPGAPNTSKNCFNGDIAFAAVYNRPFDSQDVKTHYMAGTWKRP